MSTAIAKNFQIGADGTASNNFTLYQPATPDGTLRLGNGNTGITSSLLTLTSGGNLGLGVTPSAFNLAGYKAIEVGALGNLLVGGSYNFASTSNAYYNSGWKYAISGTGATQYEQIIGTHNWKIAGNGTAGNAISFTQAMTLDASGNLGVGTTSPTSRLEVIGGETRWGAGPSVGALSYTGGAPVVASIGANPLLFFTNSTERARIDSSGNLLVGVSSGSQHILSKNTGNGAGTTNIFEVQNAGHDSVAIFMSGTSYGTSNSAGTSLRIGRSNSTLRSINAGGTINASGADYAEYMTKAGEFTVAKGDVVGINADGKLTNVFDDAVSFCVKSTDPSYVGGDVWGNEDSIGKRPSKDATDEEKAAYADALEAARQKVDRIAFAGQVPVNVMGATPGQYIVPVNDNGAIKGVAKNEADMTLVEYMKAVGKVIAVKEDGRAFIIVKVA